MAQSSLDDEAATRFLEALSGNTDADWDKAYAWVLESPAHGVAFARAERAWAISGSLKDTAPTAELAFEAVAGPAGRFEALVGRRQVMAAIFASAAIGTAATVAVQKSIAVDRYRTAVGEARRFKLADGSMLFLNTNSAVEVAIRSDRRFVRLLHGEASFLVHEAERPMLIDAMGTRLESSGGGFNLRLRPDVLELTVVGGDVVLPGGGSGVQAQVVRATGSAAIRGGSVARSGLTLAQAQHRLSWQSGLVKFRGETLSQAVDEFNRYRVAPLVIGDPEIASIRVNGNFGVGASDQFVGLIAVDLGIRSVVGADRSVLLLRAASYSDHATQTFPTR